MSKAPEPGICERMEVALSRARPMLVAFADCQNKTSAYMRVIDLIREIDAIVSRAGANR